MNVEGIVIFPALLEVEHNSGGGFWAQGGTGIGYLCQADPGGIAPLDHGTVNKRQNMLLEGKSTLALIPPKNTKPTAGKFRLARRAPSERSSG